MPEQKNWPFGTKPYPERVVVPGTEPPPSIRPDKPLAVGKCTDEMSDEQLLRGADQMPSRD